MSRHTARAILLIGLLLAFVTGCSPWPVCGARSHVQCHNAGELYRSGLYGYPRDRARALRHFEEGCKRRFAPSCRVACEMSTGWACNALGVSIIQGARPDNWRIQAHDAFERACALGSPSGCGNIGKLLLETGTGPDRGNKARDYLEMACDQGLDAACHDLKGYAANLPQPTGSPPPTTNAGMGASSHGETGVARPRGECGEAQVGQWAQLGGVAVHWCEDALVVRSLAGQDLLRVVSGALGDKDWVFVGRESRALCIDRLSSLLGTKEGESSLCLSIQGLNSPLGLNANGTEVILQGKAWRLRGDNIAPDGPPALRLENGRFGVGLSER